jgi:hypothetical protein
LGFWGRGEKPEELREFRSAVCFYKREFLLAHVDDCIFVANAALSIVGITNLMYSQQALF